MEKRLEKAELRYMVVFKTFTPIFQFSLSSLYVVHFCSDCLQGCLRNWAKTWMIYDVKAEKYC